MRILIALQKPASGRSNNKKKKTSPELRAIQRAGCVGGQVMLQVPAGRRSTKTSSEGFYLTSKRSSNVTDDFTALGSFTVATRSDLFWIM